MSSSQERFARYWVRTAVAAALGASMTSMTAMAAAPPAGEDEEVELEEVRVTGSRIVRRDLQSNSPLVTIDRQQLEDSTFISVEEALNDLPQFMSGGVGNSAAAVTGLQAANGLDGGRGSGDMFNMALLPDNAGVIGIVVPGAANVNLRGLGANRSLTLVDGHRGMPVNASMTVDLNTIPTVAIGNIEVITGGASAVYGADALAGVTNIVFRDNFEGMSLRVRGGVNEVGDGGEYQVSGLMGARLADGKGHAMIGIEYSKRDPAYWKNRDFFREVMESPYSGSGSYLFAWDPYYSAGGGTGTYAPLQRLWHGNAPTQAAVNSVFSDRYCPDPAAPGGVSATCIVSATGGISSLPGSALNWGFFFNDDPTSTLYVRGSQATVGGVLTYFGPQGYNGNPAGTRENPDEIVCGFVATGISRYPGFDGERCNPGAGTRIDWGRWLSSPREAYTLFGSGKYQFDNSIEAFANFSFAASDTETRREPSPASGGFGAVIPFHSTNAAHDGNAIYLPSLITAPATGQVAGATRPEYRVGGTRGTDCPDMGGCTMAQAFPVPEELRTLLESRNGPFTTTPLASRPTITAADSPFRTLSACYEYQLAANPNAIGAQLNTATNQFYTVTVDPNTGQPMSKCGPNSGWLLNTQLGFLGPRGTTNTGRLYQLAAGLRGDVGLSDWTWELYTSYGDSQTQTNYNNFMTMSTLARILSAPNYGRGYVENGVSSKYFSCSSGLNPFDPGLVVSQDCIDAIESNQIDRNSMVQKIYEVTAQGHVFDLPAGEARAAVGAGYRKNEYMFTPDSLRERDYIWDANAGAFAAGSVDESVSVKEAYGELLLPLLRDLPAVRNLELELGFRTSSYSTGQDVDTYKVLASWEPVAWLRARGGYNRAERAPNMSELFATPSGSAQFAAFPVDPCRTSDLSAPPNNLPLNTANRAENPNRAQLQALCAAQIDQYGGNASSEFHLSPTTFDIAGGTALIVGNPNVRNERGDTWTLGLAFSSPFTNPLLSRITGTLDWYEARVTDPIEVIQTSTIVNSCFNVNGLNPDYSLTDPQGYCSLIERDPVTGAIARVYNSFGNQGKLVIRGMDLSARWSATLVDLGVGEAPGTLSLAINGNYLIDQLQFYGGGTADDYAGFGGASRIRTNTSLGYNWGQGHRVSLNWQYRLGTHTATTFAAASTANGITTSPTLQRNLQNAGYGTTNLFALTAGTQFGVVSASVTVNNLLNTKPKPGGYDFRDPREGFGSFSPFADLVGRRYSVNLSMDF